MIVRVQSTEEGFIVVLPAEAAEAWQLREGFPLEVHRVGSSAEEDEPIAIKERLQKVIEVFESTLPKHDEAFRELAKGREGIGPHDPLPFDLRKL
jgi:hypothetical protein